MDSAKFNKYQQAGEIVNLALKKAKELCQEKQKASYVCIFCDTLIKESLDKIHSKESKRVLVNLVVLMASVDGYICDNEEKSVFKIMESLGESTKDYFYFNDDGNLDIQTVIDNELNILSELPPTHPI